jgi:aryl-alcohol dehydrogenase-like predicted oxidoreductase
VEQRPLGKTGISVSVVGLGAGRIGGDDFSEAQVDRLIGAALDAGVTLIDTARSYGLSEERLGRALAGRRERVVLSTKVGYGVPGIADWTGPVIAAGVNAALERMRTDHIDVVHLHSCPVETLERSGVVEALARAVESGRVRVAAYSGEGEALLWAIRSGAFGAVQCSVSIVDQSAPIADARARGLGVLAKRPLGNAPWRFQSRPAEPDVAEAWDRFHALRLDAGGLAWPALFSRFAAFAPGVSALLVGTASAEHLAEVASAVEQGPVPAETNAGLREAFARVGQGWAGRI